MEFCTGQAAFANLSPSDRELVALRVIRDLDQREAAPSGAARRSPPSAADNPRVFLPIPTGGYNPLTGEFQG